MNLQFDHAVHYVNSGMYETVERLRDAGLHAVPGGRHERFGTYNSLAYFDLGYIEYLGVDDLAFCQTQARDNRFLGQLLEDLPKGEGLGTVALRTDDIEHAARHLKSQGIRVSGPFEGQRTRTDGSLLRWKMMLPASDESHVPMPFIIQWEQPDEERRTDYRHRGIIAPHPLGDLRISRIVYAVWDAEATARQWEAWYGITRGDTYDESSLQARCIDIPFPGGTLALCSPHERENGRVSRVLQERGERPFLIQCRGAVTPSAHTVMGAAYQFLR